MTDHAERPAARADVLAARFRANPRYELLLFDRLPLDEQTRFADLKSDPDLYGILRPREAGPLTIKSVGRETALLFLTLQEPAPLPAYVAATGGTDAASAMAQLVLDGVLEIECPDGAGGARLVSGPDAFAFLYPTHTTSVARGHLAQLSVEALRYAEVLDIDDIGRLSARLYFYNRLPASSRWLQRLPDADAVVKWLGIAGDTPAGRILRDGWRELPVAVPYDGWRAWQRRDTPAQGRGGGYKVYVSAGMDALPGALPAIIAALGAAGALRFKIGRDVYGLVRPDKLVAYFRSFEDVTAAGDRLRASVAGCPVHGVPFTADLAGEGLASWGVDPPRAERTPGWHEHESWRLWLTNRLAVALRAARTSRDCASEPWRFALARVALEGVDTTTWTPMPSMWAGARASQ